MKLALDGWNYVPTLSLVQGAEHPTRRYIKRIGGGIDEQLHRRPRFTDRKGSRPRLAPIETPVKIQQRCASRCERGLSISNGQRYGARARDDAHPIGLDSYPVGIGWEDDMGPRKAAVGRTEQYVFTLP